ncbi:competence type IV pilus major pilin ComGC [Pseudoneobacillus sp. C159]
MKNQKGFTLIEMMIVLMIISVLLIITIPNVTKHNENINTKGCDAFLKMAQAQVQAYQLEKGKLPESITILVTEGYLKSEKPSACGNDKVLKIENGLVITAAAPPGS